MKRLLLIGITAVAMLFTFNTGICAQGFLGKLLGGAGESTDSLANDTTEIKTPKWDKIPNYTLVMIKLKDKEGNSILNADGSEKIKVLFRSDKDNNEYRSSEVVHQQCRELDKLVTRIIAKVGGGAAIGAIGGALLSGKKDKGKGAIIGGLAGAGAGVALSAGDIKRAKAVKKQTKALQKLLEVYQRNFTNEGDPINASADFSNIDGIDFSKNQTAMVSEEADELCKKEAFNNPSADWM